MASRRAFLAGLIATSALPRATWAEAGGAAFLSAARAPDGAYHLCGLTARGEIAFTLPLPERGHAAAAHPHLAQAVAFARRPGTYALVIDCVSGDALARLETPQGRHFYGHGTFSADGTRLFTTENDYDAGLGVIGIWDAENGYARLGEFASGGTGPHDIQRLPDGKTLVVANGGIETHPDTGRLKLNIPTMRPNLTYLSADGTLLERVELEPAQRKNSIRHLAVDSSGTVAFAMQWQGDDAPELPLLGLHSRETGQLRFAPAASIPQMQGYLGSVAITPDGGALATTSPRSARLQVFAGTELTREAALEDVCGVAATKGGFIATSGTGLVVPPEGAPIRHPLAWDNHLIAI
ncbi:DUF1513 domain-containing protein [Pseudoruegeria sp. SHC-113]|uniref:DUF1513 domain-containing protein n=1 Tax=Pseudoruegeria sp. SHC-113 TaxID=2855439 RepID=UPI0021BAA9A9|nr:DUF1513 domain-containing protein [Pseudoruegeria sp. SHC-113]MCT8162174.1 DUF1513 domain-containing protein [Pseudoruegeria sp. SHC-113]